MPHNPAGPREEMHPPAAGSKDLLRVVVQEPRAGDLPDLRGLAEALQLGGVADVEIELPRGGGALYERLRLRVPHALVDTPGLRNATPQDEGAAERHPRVLAVRTVSTDHQVLQVWIGCMLRKMKNL